MEIRIYFSIMIVGDIDVIWNLIWLNNTWYGCNMVYSYVIDIFYKILQYTFLIYTLWRLYPKYTNPKFLDKLLKLLTEYESFLPFALTEELLYALCCIHRMFASFKKYFLQYYCGWKEYFVANVQFLCLLYNERSA